MVNLGGGVLKLILPAYDSSDPRDCSNPTERKKWSRNESRVEPFFLLNNNVCEKNGASVQNGTILELELKWLLLRKWSYNQPFLLENGTTLQSGTKTVPKWGPCCGHEMAPQWNHFGSTFSFQYMFLEAVL